MDSLLLELLRALEMIGKNHGEIYDTECRQAMGDAIYFGFLKSTESYIVPESFRLLSDSGNAHVRAAISKYIELANQEATVLGITNFHDRLDAFQNEDVCTDGGRNYYDDFFGYSRHEDFDTFGNAVC